MTPTCPTRRSSDHELADDGQDHILRRNAKAQGAFDPDLHRLGLFQKQRLRSQDVFDFTGPNAERQSAQSTVGGRMAIAANKSCARQGKPLFRRSEEHTSELQSLMRISYAVFCLKKKKEDKSLIYNQ